MKTKTKKLLLRLFNLIFISFIVLNTIIAFGGMGGISKATDVWNEIRSNTDMSNVPMLQLEALLTGLTYVFTLILKIIIVGVGAVLQLIMSGIYKGFEGSGSSFKIVTTEDIILAGTQGHSNFLSVDFLSNIGDGTLAGTFRQSVAQWYYSLRLVAAAGLLVILIYVGIKMVLSTIGKDQARYKEMFIDWVCSVALLFMLHWIIAFVIIVNDALMTGIATTESGTTGTMLSALASHLFDAGFHSILAAVIYTVLVGQIFKFFVLYIKRMITVGFLIMISPLISITYSIDKMGDKKAQALSAWLKELSYNILIQPFHAIIFFSFYGSITDMVNGTTTGTSIAPYVFSIVILSFMSKAEEIVRHIFHFEARHMGSMKEAASTLGAASGMFQKLGNSASKAMPKFRQAGGLRGLAPVAFKDMPIGKNSKSKKLSDKKAKKAASAAAGAVGAAGAAGAAADSAGATPKKTTAQKMKEKMQEVKEKRKEKAIEKRARQNYDKRLGEGAYEYRKQQAANGSKDAERILESEKETAKTQLENEKKTKAVEKEVKKSVNRYHGNRSAYKVLSKAADSGDRSSKKRLEDEREIAGENYDKKMQAKQDKKDAKAKKAEDARQAKEKKAEEKKHKEKIMSENAPQTELDSQVKKKIDAKKGKGAYERLKDQKENGTPKGKKDAEKMLEEAEREVLDENVKKSIDAKHGKGSYDNLKNNPNLDSGFWDRAREEERDKLKNQPAKRKISGVKNSNGTDSGNTTNNNTTNNNTTNNSSKKEKKEITGVRKWFSDGFTDMRVKEQWGATKALFEDSTKVAAAIALGGFAFGATDSLGTTYAAGQFGYGFADGLWENSSRTVTNDLQEMLQKYVKLNGANVDLDDLPQFLETLKNNSNRGMYDKLEEMQRQLSGEFKKYISEATERSNVFFDIDEAIAKDGGEVDIDEIFQRYFAKSKDAVANESSIKAELANYANKMMEASIAKSIDKFEATGMSIGTASQIVEKKVKKTQQSVNININIDGDVNRASVDVNDGNGNNTTTTFNNRRQQTRPQTGTPPRSGSSN